MHAEHCCLIDLLFGGGIASHEAFQQAPPCLLALEHELFFRSRRRCRLDCDIRMHMHQVHLDGGSMLGDAVTIDRRRSR